METLLELDKEALLFFNGLHAAWLDPVMYLITKTIFWLPLYLFLLWLMYKQEHKNIWCYLLGIALTIILADQVTSGFMKPFFERLRPSQDPALEGLLHLVNGYKGGLYGFASGHSANTFGTAIFMYLLFRQRRPWMWVIFLWAAVMTYSRIYLGVHYPGDILVGGLIGLTCGWIGFQLAQWLKHRWGAHPTPTPS